MSCCGGRKHARGRAATGAEKVAAQPARRLTPKRTAASSAKVSRWNRGSTLSQDKPKSE